MANTRTIHLPTIAHTERLAAAIAAMTRPGDAILLQGPLGSGKSTFARAFLRSATGDPTLEVPSPTFTLVQGYDTDLGMVHHYDLWRIEEPSGLRELGWDDSLEDIVLVEWPERLGPYRPDDPLIIVLGILDDTARTATLEGWPDRIGRIA